MINIMQIGTCRLALRNTDRFSFYKYFSTAHTASQILQNIKLLKGLEPPEMTLLNLLFAHNEACGEDEERAYQINLRRLGKAKLNFAKSQALVIEISSIKNMVSEGWHLHWNHKKGMHPGLQKVAYECHNDDASMIIEKIKSILDIAQMPVLFLSHQNRAKLPPRETISNALSAQGEYFDPTPLVLEHGFETTMTDENHFTTFMYAEVQRELLQRLEKLFPKEAL